MLLGFLVAAVNLLQEISVEPSSAKQVPMHNLDDPIQCGVERVPKSTGHILDEVTLFLGGGVDRRALGGLGLGTAAGGSPGASEDCAESSHGELLKQERPRSVHVAFTCSRTRRGKGWARRRQPAISGGGRALTTWEPTFLPAIW